MATQATRTIRNGLGGAAKVGSSSRAPAARSSAIEERRYVLLRGVPRTVILSDVHRALKDAGAVEQSFALENIVAEPPYLPPTTPVVPPSPYRTFHITTPSAGHAKELQSFLFSHSLFPASNQVLELSKFDRKDWAQNLIDRAASRSGRAGTHMALVKANVKAPEPVDVDWLYKPGFRGRRVLISGLPGRVARARLEILASGCEVQNLTQLPPHPRSLFSAHLLTFPSVALAYKFHRKVHMTHFDRKNWNHEFLIRSEVQW